MIKQMITRFQKLSLISRLCLILSVLFVLSLIPLLHMSLYAHSAGDDYTYGLQAHLCWEETHSLPAVIQAAFQNTKNTYQTWQGTYSSIFLMSLQPAVISERLYPLTTLLMLGMLIASHFFFLRTLFTYYIKLSKSLWISLTLAVLFLSIQILDSGKEAFFWYNGAVHYVFMHSCMLFLLGLLLLFLKAEKKSSCILYLLLSCFLAFVTGGANYVTVLITPLCLWVVISLCLLYKSKRGWFLLIPFVISLIGLAINVMAPGNAVRMSVQIAPLSAPEAIYQSFLYAIKGIGNWTTLYVIFFVLLLLPFLFSALYQTNFDFPLPGLAAGSSFCLIAASYTPSLYSMGHVIIFDRTLNIMRMLYYLLVFLNLMYVTGWLAGKCRRYKFLQNPTACVEHLKTHLAKSFLLTMTAFFLCLAIFSDKNSVTSLSALHALRQGYAQIYHTESLNRIALLSMPDYDEVWVPNFSVCPSLLDPQELSTDPSVYPNPTIAQWFGKTTLHLSIVY